MDRNKSLTYKGMASAIKDRLSDRPYSLGLDLGVGSIGLAVVALEADESGELFPTDLIHATSRIFPSSQGAADRRMKRGQRNAIRHKAHRMEILWKVLSEKGLMLPFSKKEVSDPARLRFSEEEIRKDPYLLRLKGLKEQITLSELGVALYHIAGHRGSSSIRTFLDAVETKDEEKAKAKIRETEEISRNTGLNTFIEILYESKRVNNTNFRNSLNASDKTPLPTRDVIENEIDQLLNRQKEYYPQILADSYVQRIKDTMLYENDKIVPESGNCPYFPNEKKLPKASFINEERRLWEAVNNVRIVVEDKVENRFVERSEHLNTEKKYLLFNTLREGKDIKVTQFKSLFPEYKNAKEIKLQGTTKKTQEIKGFRFKELENSPWYDKLTEEDRLSFIETYVNCPDDTKFKQVLKNKFSLSEEEVKQAMAIKLVDGYAPVGLSAMRIILNYIITEGLSYQEAEKKAIDDGALKCEISDIVFDSLPYYGIVMPQSTQAIAGKAWHSAFEEKRKGKGFIIPVTNKEEAQYGKIANPVVHQSLNELRKLVNELIDVLGKKPDRICIEIARDLKVGKDKREELSRENNKREAYNKEIYTKYCLPNNLGRNSIKKFKLFEEQNGKCPYCLRTISATDIVSNNVDIDHVFPDEDTGDSSYDNLVLAHKTCNETKKAKRIPYIAFGSDVALWSKIEQYLTTTSMSKSKQWRFKASEEEYDEYLENKSFLPRFSSDNAYVAKIACQYLQSLYLKDDRLKSVRTIRSHETAMLRSAWHLNGITNGLAETAGLVREGEYVDEKNRTDNRHHALDAIVAAYFTQKYATIIQTAAAKNISPKTIKKRLPIPKYYRLDKDLAKDEQIKEFSNEVRKFIENKTFVSRKQIINKNGELVKDTQYSIVASNKDDLVRCAKKAVKDIKAEHVYGDTAKDLEYILIKSFKKPPYVSEEENNKIDSLLAFNKKKFEDILSLLDEAQEELESKNLKLKEEGKKVKEIKERDKLSLACTKAGGVYYQLSNQKNNKLHIKHSTNSAFDTGDNFCLDLYFGSDGKIHGEVIRKVNAIRKDYIPEYKKEGFELLERIYPKDVLEVDLIPAEGTGKKALSQSIISANAPEGRTFIVVDTFTEIPKTIQVWFSPLCVPIKDVQSSFTISGISKMNLRKVVLSNLGLVVYRSKLLKES